MQLKANLTTKMVAYFIIVVLISAAGFAFMVSETHSILTLNKQIQQEDLTRLAETNEVAYNAMGQLANFRGYLATGNEQLFNDYKVLSEKNDKIEQSLLDRARTEQGRKLISEVMVLDAKYSEIAEQKIAPLKRAGKDQEALQLTMTELAPVARDLAAKADEYKQMRNKQIDASFKDAVAKAERAEYIAIIAGILSGILGIMIGFFSARSIARPVNSLAEAAQKVAAGDLTQRVEVTSNDEIGLLANAFGTMVSNLKEVIHHVQANAEQVASSSEELTASADQSAQAANQVAISITDVAHGMDKQLQAANEASAVVEQMSASIQQVAANANNVAEQSVKATATAKEGSKSVETAVNQMTEIELKVSSSAQVVTRLGERSKEIGQIVDTISGIAGQTNLLALNAAIEAARAGEQGRGFAVVAEEVRKLAEQSQEAAKQIATLISEIQGETDNAVFAMNEGTREVKVGTEVVNAAGTAFTQILDLVTAVSEQVRESSAAMQQMAGSSQQIVHAVKDIETSSKEVAGEAQTVSAATEEQSASMEEIASSSQGLAKMAQDLQEAVSKFRV